MQDRLLLSKKKPSNQLLKIYYRLGTVYKELKQFNKALSAFDSALKLFSKKSTITDIDQLYLKNAEVMRADILFKNSKYPKARIAYETIKKKYSNEKEADWASYQIGKIYQRQGDLLRAKKAYNDLIEEKGELNFWARQAKFALDSIEWKREYKQAVK